MPGRESDPDRRELLAAATLAGVLVAVGSLAVTWGRLLLSGSPPIEPGEVVLGVVAGAVLMAATFVPFLLAVLVVVADPTPRAVAGGAVLVYAVELLTTLARPSPAGPLGGRQITVLAVPLGRVVIFFAIATAVWLAYHGGYDRIASAAGNADQHPLFAAVADERIAPGLSLQRGLVAAGLAALVAAGGLVVVGELAEFLRAVTRPETGGTTTVVFHPAGIPDVGIALTELPTRWLFEASFLLAVLFVTGPRLGVADLLKGVAVVVGVQTTVTLLPALLPPFRPVEFWAASGPVLTPLGDVVLLSSVAVAVWLAFHGGLETLQRHVPGRPVPE